MFINNLSALDSKGLLVVLALVAGVGACQYKLGWRVGVVGYNGNPFV